MLRAASNCWPSVVLWETLPAQSKAKGFVNEFREAMKEWIRCRKRFRLRRTALAKSVSAPFGHYGLQSR